MAVLLQHTHKFGKLHETCVEVLRVNMSVGGQRAVCKCACVRVGVCVCVFICFSIVASTSALRPLLFQWSRQRRRETITRDYFLVPFIICRSEGGLLDREQGLCLTAVLLYAAEIFIRRREDDAAYLLFNFLLTTKQRKIVKAGSAGRTNQGSS